MWWLRRRPAGICCGSGAPRGQSSASLHLRSRDRGLIISKMLRCRAGESVTASRDQLAHSAPTGVQPSTLKLTADRLPLRAVSTS